MSVSALTALAIYLAGAFQPDEAPELNQLIEKAQKERTADQDEIKKFIAYARKCNTIFDISRARAMPQYQALSSKSQYEIEKIPPNYMGWITGPLGLKSELSDIGIELPKKFTSGAITEGGLAVVTWHDVTVTPSQMDKLDHMWGTFIWGLE